MPSLEVDDYGVTPVTTLVKFFEEALDAASTIKPTSAIDPPLEEADLKGVIDRLPTTPHTGEPQDGAALRQERHHRFAVIETAARGVLSNLIVCDFVYYSVQDSGQLTFSRPRSPSTRTTSSKYGTCLMYYNAFPIAANATRLCSYGSSKTSSTARPSRDVARFSITSSRGGNASYRKTLMRRNL